MDHLSEPKHQNYCEPIIIDQENPIAEKKSLVSQGKRNSTDKVTVRPKKKKKKKIKTSLTLQWFHAQMIYPES